MKRCVYKLWKAFKNEIVASVKIRDLKCVFYHEIICKDGKQVHEQCNYVIITTITILMNKIIKIAR